jgi:soluble lytic murein transglycosylase-like protein
MRFCLEVVLETVVLTCIAASGLQAGDVIREPVQAAQAPRAVWVVRVDARTGKLVRSMLSSQPAAGQRGKTAEALASDASVRSLVHKTAIDFEVSPLLVDSVIQVESNYNPLAVSPKGAQGLMQLMPATARRFGVTDTFDPKQNIEAGVRYLKLLQDTFQDERLAIAAYNAGEKAVAKYGDVPPYPETMNYVAKVGQKYGQAQRAAGKSEEAKSAPAPKAYEDGPRHILAYVDPDGRLHIATR